MNAISRICTPHCIPAQGRDGVETPLRAELAAHNYVLVQHSNTNLHKTARQQKARTGNDSGFDLEQQTSVTSAPAARLYNCRVQPLPPCQCFRPAWGTEGWVFMGCDAGYTGCLGAVWQLWKHPAHSFRHRTVCQRLRAADDDADHDNDLAGEFLVLVF